MKTKLLLFIPLFALFIAIPTSISLAQKSGDVFPPVETEDDPFLSEDFTATDSQPASVSTTRYNRSTADYSGSRYYSTDTDIRKQTIKDLTDRQNVDAEWKAAKQLGIPAPAPAAVVPPLELPSVVFTPGDIISSMLKPELAEKKIDLDFDATDLRDVLVLLAETGQVNIVLDPTLNNNKLDLHLKQVTLKEALLLIGNSYDLGFKRVDSSLYVTKKDKLREQNMVTKLIKLKNISVEDAKSIVQNLVDVTNASHAINSMIVTGEPEKLVEVEKIIKQIDIPQPQVIIEAKIIEINKDALKDLGVDWSDQISISNQESGRPVDLENIEDSPSGGVLKTFSLSRTPIQFDTVIKMLENQNKAKVLSNPRIATLNDKEATIFVGDRIPYTVTTISGGVATSDVRFEEPGIRLSITPSIIDKDFVVIKVEPEVSFIFAYRGPNDAYPHTKKRQATAYVRVKDNQPFVLGGLLNEEDKQNLFKVPFLGSVPLLGNLFSYEKHVVTNTELIITITPRVVHGEI